MIHRHTWWCVAALVALVAGCAEDIPTTELGKLAELAPKPKQEEKKEPENPFALPSATDGASQTEEQQPAPTEAAPTEPAPSAQPTPQAGGGYGGVATKSVTFGQPVVIKLASEVEGFDLAKAEGGVGKRGQGYGGGIITEPVRQYFIAQDRIKLNIEIPNNLKMYRALGNNKNPPTVEAFVKEVLDPSGIVLPDLSPGEFYVYDPNGKGLEDVLFVARPRK